MNEKVNIDFKVMRSAVKDYARQKARDCGGSIIYFQDKQIIEENPATSKKIIVAARLDS